MDIKQLECFVNLAETLNFSKTAELMYLSQPAVTGQIKSLEKEMGMIFFQRNKRAVKLTPAGEMFYHEMKQILELFYRAVNRAKYEANKYLEKFIILYEDNYLAVKYLSKLIYEFRQLHPDVSIELKIAHHDSKKQLYLDHMIDFMFTVDEGLDEYDNLVFEPLYQGKYVCIISPEHDFVNKKSLTFSDLNNEHLILLNPIQAPQEMKRLIDRISNECQQTSVQFCDSVFSGYTLVKSGMGIAVMPDFVCLEDQETVMIELAGYENIIYGVAWNRQSDSKNRQDFIKIAKKIYHD